MLVMVMTKCSRTCAIFLLLSRVTRKMIDASFNFQFTVTLALVFLWFFLQYDVVGHVTSGQRKFPVTAGEIPIHEVT